jgi:hypothetical protein
MAAIDLGRAKRVTDLIVEAITAGTPAEYQYGLTLATAIYFKANFPHDLEAAFRLHVENLRAALEELDKREVLDLSVVDMGEG